MSLSCYSFERRQQTGFDFVGLLSRICKELVREWNFLSKRLQRKTKKRLKDAKFSSVKISCLLVVWKGQMEGRNVWLQVRERKTCVNVVAARLRLKVSTDFSLGDNIAVKRLRLSSDWERTVFVSRVQKQIMNGT